MEEALEDETIAMDITGRDLERQARKVARPAPHRTLRPALNGYRREDVKGIVSFESGEVEEDYGTYQTVFAVDASGEKHDLSGAVSDADYTIPSEFLGEWTATVTHDTAEQGSYDSDYILTLTDGGGLTVQDINSEVGLFFEYTGQLNYLGTNGEGMVFGYHLNENAGTVRYGAFTLLRGSDGLHVKSVAGENFFDAPSGRYTVFARG